MSIKDKIYIITGASSGIGEATAKKLTSNGAKVALMARSEDKLKTLQTEIKLNNGEAIVTVGDVTNPNDFNNAVNKVIDTYGTVDGLINNAGLMPLSFIKNLKTDEWEKMVDVNIKGVLNGVAAVLPKMKENKSGDIINVSSVAAHQYFPGGGVYCATKAAVKMFSEGLRKELSPTYGINVTSIEPGAVATNLTSTITDEEVIDKLSMLQGMKTLESEDIANAIYYALTQPKHVNIGDVYIMPSDQQ